jgi:tetratricopeptide (TPR) repeat protein/mono/diheme cytochrome c family protein
MASRRTITRRLAAFAALVCALDLTTSRIGSQTRPQPAVTFSEHVAPILFSRCAGCHDPRGSAPFSLLTFASARQHATQIAEVTAARIMPPWKVEPALGPFVGLTPLSDQEIATIAEWVAQGAPEGDPARLPAAPSPADDWRLGTPDLVVTLPEPYVLPPAGADVFRIFAIPLPIDVTRYVRGVEFRPGNARVVHHANVRIDRTRNTRRLDDEDQAPGYDGLVAPSVSDPDGHFLGWTPGQAAPLLPADLAWRLDPGTDLVLETHMLPSGKPELVRPSLGLYFADEPPRRKPLMLRLGRQNIDIAAGEDAYTVSDRFVLPVDVELHALQPHAHFRAREVKAEVLFPDGSSQMLIQIRDWDFRWQHVYRLVTPRPLPKGTTVSMAITYDNSSRNARNPQLPPRRVLWGQRSFDEMGDVWLQLLTRTDAEQDVLYRAIRPKMAAESLQGYRMLILADPARPSLHDDAALLAHELGRYDEEVAHFEASLKLQPRSAAAHQNLATALADAGQLAAAVPHFAQALAIDPNHGLARTNFGRVLIGLGRLGDAAVQYEHAIRIDPLNAPAHNDLGFIRLERGDLTGALEMFREAAAIDSSLGDAYYNLGRTLRRLGRIPDAIEQFRRAVTLNPEWPPALANLAWLLAAAPRDAHRVPATAVSLAERAATLTARRDPAVLDVLAAAYAAAGAFDRAVDTVVAALDLLPSGSSRAGLQSRERAYRARQAHRLPEGEIPPSSDLLAPLR